MSKTFVKRLDEPDKKILSSLAWEIAEVGEEIPYSALMVSRRKPTQKDIERGLELAKKYAWL